MAEAAAFTLITFDVDGTLLGQNKAAEESAHNRAYGVAVGKVLGDGPPTPPVARLLERKEIHGSTDGLILLRLARAALGVTPSDASSRLDEMMDEMYSYIASLDDEEVARGVDPLPGVFDRLEALSTMKDQVACGLVTGNVEGIARRKMRAVGILGTGALAPPSDEQQMMRRRQCGGEGELGECRWQGSEHIGFLGGFGSDFCSGNVDDAARNHLDRAEQIAIAARRCRDSCLGGTAKKLRRVVHVGDAPSDVLAARAYAEGAVDGGGPDEGCCVGMVAVATGSYGADELRNLAGKARPGVWEPVVLEKGMADPDFLRACGVA